MVAPLLQQRVEGKQLRVSKNTIFAIVLCIVFSFHGLADDRKLSGFRPGMSREEIEEFAKAAGLKIRKMGSTAYETGVNFNTYLLLVGEKLYSITVTHGSYRKDSPYDVVTALFGLIRTLAEQEATPGIISTYLGSTSNGTVYRSIGIEFATVKNTSTRHLILLESSEYAHNIIEIGGTPAEVADTTLKEYLGPNGEIRSP